MRGRKEEARRALSRITSLHLDSSEVTAELKCITTNMHTYGSGSYLDCFRLKSNKAFIRVLTAVLLQVFMMVTGSTSTFDFLFTSPWGIQNYYKLTIVVTSIGAGSGVLIVFLIDKIGRRTVLLVSTGSMFICLYLIGIIGLNIPDNNLAGQRALCGLAWAHQALFYGPWLLGMWAVTSEILPLSIRAKAMAIWGVSNWLCKFGFDAAQPHFHQLGLKIYFVWGSGCLACFLFTYCVILETGGLSLEQIDILYEKTGALGSKECRRKLVAQHLFGGALELATHPDQEHVLP